MVSNSVERSTLTLLDTNLLVYASDTKSEFHVPSNELLVSAHAKNAGFCITPQIASEFCAVVTDRRRVRNPVSPADAVTAIKEVLLLPGLTLLPVPFNVTELFLGLLAKYPCVGTVVFDAFLVATMLGNGVRRLYTYNSRDFGLFEGIEVLQPPQNR